MLHIRTPTVSPGRGCKATPCRHQRYAVGGSRYISECESVTGGSSTRVNTPKRKPPTHAALANRCVSRSIDCTRPIAVSTASSVASTTQPTPSKSLRSPTGPMRTDRDEGQRSTETLGERDPKRPSCAGWTGRIPANTAAVTSTPLRGAARRAWERPRAPRMWNAAGRRAPAGVVITAAPNAKSVSAESKAVKVKK